MNEQKKTARTAGLWWLLFIIAGPVSYLVVDGKLLAPGDTAATLGNIGANTTMFWAGAAAFFAGYAFFILLGRTLCKLFKTVGLGLTKTMMCLVIAGTVLVAAGKVAEIAGAVSQNVETAAFLFDLRANIEITVELFWGLWLIPLVLLIFKSNFFPKIIGAAAVLAVVYHLAVFGAFFTTGIDVSVNPVLMAFGMIGELAVVLWLLIKGVKTASGSGEMSQ